MAIVFVSSCATKTEGWSPVGTWDYTVKDTPNGDGYGTLILTEEKGNLSGILRSPDFGDASLTNLVLDGNKLSAEMYLAGIDMSIQGTFEDNSMTGKVVAPGYGEFPLEATRQSEQ